MTDTPTPRMTVDAKDIVASICKNIADAYNNGKSGVDLDNHVAAIEQYAEQRAYEYAKEIIGKHINKQSIVPSHVRKVRIQNELVDELNARNESMQGRL